MDFSFFDWSYLGTFAGSLAAVLVVTELIKDIAWLKKIPTQIVSWILALAVILLAQGFTGGLTAQSGVIAVFNAAMVSLAANGGYEALKRILGGNTDETKNTDSNTGV